MAIPAAPTNVTIQTANQENLVSWSISTGATSYSIQRSTDGVNFTTLATQAATSGVSYLDTAVTIGTQYWYQVAAVNGDGTSGYAVPGIGYQTSVIPTPTSEMSLAGIRFASQQKADRVNSNFVTTPEYTTYINLAMKELYDLLITVYEDYFMAPRIQFLTTGQQNTVALYPLPNGSNQFIDAATQQTITPAPFYKMLGVDLGLNNANNSFVTVNKYNFIDRNRYIYPNTASTIYSAFNLQYRIMGTNLELIPNPSANQLIQLCYIPRLPDLLKDTDYTTIGFSGWLEYVIVRTAKYVLDKEESDTSKLDAELLFIKSRIEESASNRDAGQPDRISNTRGNGWWGDSSGGFGWNGSIGGWAIAPLGLLPRLVSNNVAYHSLSNSILTPELLLRIGSSSILIAYLSYLAFSKLGGRILFTRVRNFISRSSSTFFSHIRKIIGLSPKEQMIRIDTARDVTFVANNVAVGNLTVDCFPAISVSEELPLPGFPARFYPETRISHGNLTITELGSLTRPQPATVGLVDLSPKISRHNPIITYNYRGSQ